MNLMNLMVGAFIFGVVFMCGCVWYLIRSEGGWEK